MKGSLVSSLLLFLLILMLSDTSSTGMAEEARMPHKCMKSYNITGCNKLECVKVCTENGVPWENGACLDEHQCCCYFAFK